MTGTLIIKIVILVVLFVPIFFLSCFIAMTVVTRKLSVSNDLGATADNKYDQEDLKNLEMVASQDFNIDIFSMPTFMQSYANDPFKER